MLFSTSIRVQIAAGAAHAVFLEVEGIPRRMLKPRLRLSCVFFLKVRRRRRFSRSLILGLGSALISWCASRPIPRAVIAGAGPETSFRGPKAIFTRCHRFRQSSDRPSHHPLERMGPCPSALVARMNALGLLQISCISAAPGSQQSWPLEFNMRLHDQGGASVPGARPSREATVQIEPNAAADALETARKQIGMAFAQPGSKSKKGKVTAGTILKSLERILGSPRSGWNGPLLRALWPALEEQLDSRRLSVDHEEAWLIIAGFLLRPGFGVVRRRPSYRRPVAPARRRPMFSRSAHQEPGIHPMAASGRRPHARTPEQASDRRDR